jgi:AAA+ ATPase superfamily predicted ATPase
MIISRIKELEALRNAKEADESRFIAVYGRRRVGKTFLVREAFEYHFVFQHAGLSPQDGGKTKKAQLEAFAVSLKKSGLKNFKKPESWLDAFSLLEDLIDLSDEPKKVIFIDELSWMDTKKSDFLPALEYFWNARMTARKDIVLVVCASATSWMMKKIVHNRGGLYNRLNLKINLQPFTLSECESFAAAKGIRMNRYQLLECYMILGGIPYYWDQLNKSLGLSQNIDALFFADHPILEDEFRYLYASVFNAPEPYIRIVTALGKKKVGMYRDELLKETRIPDSGTFSELLSNLESCGFIRHYDEFGKTKRNKRYQLIDNFTLFYFRFVEGNSIKNPQFWSRSIGGGTYNAWSGLAFESVCFQHVDQIKQAFGVTGVISGVYSWLYRPKENYETGVQIDMLLDRADYVIDLCEIKYTRGLYEINKQYSAELRRKVSVFQSKTETKKAVFTVMITAEGLAPNAYAGDIQNSITAEELFT